MRVRLVRFLVLLVCAFGCSTAPPKPAMMADMARGELTVAQLRAIDYEFASHFGQLVAACAAEVVEQSDAADIRDRAYQWRMWASPQARAAAFDQDPFAGLLELWVLATQQRNYFGEGGGKDYFGNEATCVRRTTEYLEDTARELAAEVIPAERWEMSSASVDQWVLDHPIEGELFVRPTARADIASLVPSQTHGGLKAVGSIEETITDLNARLAILTVQMPPEIRWQAEYLINALFEERVNEPADTLLAAVDDVTTFLGEFESTLAGQRELLMDGIQLERIAVFESIEEERAMILSTVEQERMAVLAELDKQMASVTTELDKVGRGLIDHFFVRLIEVLLVMGVVMILTVLLVLVVIRKRNDRDD